MPEQQIFISRVGVLTKVTHRKPTWIQQNLSVWTKMIKFFQVIDFLFCFTLRNTGGKWVVQMNNLCLRPNSTLPWTLACLIITKNVSHTPLRQHLFRFRNKVWSICWYWVDRCLLADINSPGVLPVRWSISQLRRENSWAGIPADARLWLGSRADRLKN